MALKTAFPLLAFSLGLNLALGQAQVACREGDLARMCQTALPDGFTFLKRFLAPSQAQTQEFSYVFSKDTEYAISLCTPEGRPADVKLTLMDSYRNPIFSNYDKKTKTYYQAIGYMSQSTGVFHLKLEHQKPGQPCMLVNIGFKTGEE